MTKEKLFFELIQVAIGRKTCLSHTPIHSTSSGQVLDEWGELYAMAKKQSLVGITFAAVQKLQGQAQTPPEMLYLTWMGMAAKIQQRNEVVSKQCVALQERFAAAGYKSAVLKGQDYGRYYFYGNLSANPNLNTSTGSFDSAQDKSAQAPNPNHSNLSNNSNLSLLRQSGDIDLWVDGDRDEVIAWAKKEGAEIGHIDIKHSDMRFFSDTEVEVHFQPSWMYCPKTGKRLREWFQSFKFQEFQKVPSGFMVPPLEFSLVYCMVHIYRHFFSEGIGLRQVLDMYFLLLHSSKEQREEAMRVMDGLHMRKAVSGIMYLLQECFGMDSSMLFCKTDEKLGRFLLSEMMTTGNFGHDDYRYKHLDKSLRWQRGFIGLKRNWKYLGFFPEEVMWSPVWKVWHYCWRKRKGYL